MITGRWTTEPRGQLYRDIVAVVASFAYRALLVFHEDDELEKLRVQIRDVPPRKRHLPAERDAEPTAANRLEQPSPDAAGECRVSAARCVRLSIRCRELRTMTSEARGEWPGRSPPRRRIRDVRT